MGTTFDRARRQQVLRRLARPRRAGVEAASLLPLELATIRLRPVERRYLGIRAIPVGKIVGSDNRVGDFDRDFLPRRPHLRQRWHRVERGFPDGAFPPIVVHQLGDAYFVVDGHHRVAIARQRGMEMIDAEVTLLRARWHLSATADAQELIHAEQEWQFMQESGLIRGRPQARIRVSRPVGYLQLLENVQLHGYRLMHDRGSILPQSEIASHWFDEVYLPATQLRHRRGADPVLTAPAP